MLGFNSALSFIVLILVTLVQGKELKQDAGLLLTAIIILVLFIVNFIPYIASIK